MPMSKKQLIVSIIMTAAMVAFMVIAPRYIAASRTLLTMQRQPDAREGYQGIITVWHIVGFKPYQGSLGTWVENTAARLEKRHKGVYFQVDSITVEEYHARMARGEQPDVFSYPLGCMYVEQLSELFVDFPELIGTLDDVGRREGRLYGVPYAASGYLLIHNQRLVQERGTDMAGIGDMLRSGAAIAAGDPVQAGIYGVTGELLTLEDFLEERAVSAFVDIRAVGDLARRIQKGKGFPFEAAACGNYSDLVQLIGANVNTADDKMPYIYELIALCLEEENQKRLIEIGLMPAVNGVEKKKADNEAVELMLGELENIAAPNSFLYGTYREQLSISAREAMQGSVSAKKDMDLRLTELVRGAAIK